MLECGFVELHMLVESVGLHIHFHENWKYLTSVSPTIVHLDVADIFLEVFQHMRATNEAYEQS